MKLINTPVRIDFNRLSLVDLAKKNYLSATLSIEIWFGSSDMQRKENKYLSNRVWFWVDVFRKTLTGNGWFNSLLWRWKNIKSRSIEENDVSRFLKRKFESCYDTDLTALIWAGFQYDFFSSNKMDFRFFGFFAVWRLFIRYISISKVRFLKRWVRGMGFGVGLRNLWIHPFRVLFPHFFTFSCCYLPAKDFSKT